MKRVALFFIWAAAIWTANAQQFVVIETHDGQEVIPADDIESIMLEPDADFHARLLPRAIAADERTQLFGQALQATGLADSLMAFVDSSYPEMTERERQVKTISTGSSWDFYMLPEVRKIAFTAFVETDDVFQSQGIMNLADLTDYAHQVYDIFYPEDADVTDPTDRRNALNRFVSYHLLNRGSTDETLTLRPGFFDRELADVADWYQTFLPEGTLKVSRPNGEEEGLYLNRRGVQDRPDKYGVKVRGAKIIPSTDGLLTQVTSNGSYYYIDAILAYDEQTRCVALNERWRIDFTTLSADFMSSGLRNQNWNIGSSMSPRPIPAFLNTHLDNFVFKEKTHVVMQNYHNYYWSYGGVEVNVYPNPVDVPCDFSLHLPMLPEGDYELRLGTVAMMNVTEGLFTLNGVQLGDTVKLSSSQTRAEWEALGWRTGLPEEEQRAADRELRANGWMRGVKEWRICTMGQNSGQTVATPENSMPMCDAVGLGRRILGRFHSDGRTPLQLRIQSIPYKGDEKDNHLREHYRHFSLDFLEVCPTWIVDNEEIPEE